MVPGSGSLPRPGLRARAAGAEQNVAGPALLLEDTGTVVLDPGFEAKLGVDAGDPDPAQHRRHARPHAAEHIVDLERCRTPSASRSSATASCRSPSRWARCSATPRSRPTSRSASTTPAPSSTARGGLVANAPHIPVHLGAMARPCAVARERFPDLEPGDVVVTNDPFAGGSHLPDVTVGDPGLHAAETHPAFFVASRGHHADIGGKAPGSMPATRSTPRGGGRPARALPAGAARPHSTRSACAASSPARAIPARDPRRQRRRARGHGGGQPLPVSGPAARLVDEQGLGDAVEVSMRQLQEAAAARSRARSGSLPDGLHHFEDRLDDGTPDLSSRSVTASAWRSTSPARAPP